MNVESRIGGAKVSPLYPTLGERNRKFSPSRTLLALCSADGLGPILMPTLTSLFLSEQ